MTLRAAIYARVSSQAQRDRHTIENQLRVLPAFVASQGWTVVGTFVDDGRSAKSGQLEKRDGFAQLLAAAERREFDVLVVVDVDRLTRTDSIEERARIIGPFQRLGITIATPSGGSLDMRTMLGELWVTMQAMGAAEENRKRAERIKAGKARAIAEGRKPAGPTPFGLVYTRSTGGWSLDPAASPIVREIFERVANGDSCVVIAEDFDRRGVPTPLGWRVRKWTRDAVYRIVRNRAACGEYEANKRRGDVIRVPAIVTEREWQAAQRALIQWGRRGLRRTKRFYLLEGIATCGACGAPIGIRSSSMSRGRPNPAAYVCRARRREKTCGAVIVRCDATDAAVWAQLCDEIAQPDLLDALAGVRAERIADGRSWHADAKTHEAHLARLAKVESEIMVRFRRGTITSAGLDGELAALGRERDAVSRQLATAKRAIAATEGAVERGGAAESLVRALRDKLPTATPEQRKALLRELAYDGGVILHNGQARLDLRLVRPEAIAAQPVHAISAGYRTHAETTATSSLRIRTLASIPPTARIPLPRKSRDEIRAHRTVWQREYRRKNLEAMRSYDNERYQTGKRGPKRAA